LRDPPRLRDVARDGAEAEHALAARIANEEMSVRDRNSLVRAEVLKLRLAGPLSVIDHRLEKDVGDEGAKLRRVAVLDLELLHREIGVESDHPASGRVEVDRFPGAISDADEVGGVVQQRDVHLAEILVAFALTDVPNE